MPYISFKLVQLLLFANFLFIFTDFIIIYDSLFPIINQSIYPDFIAMPNFDGDLSHNLTYYVKMESVRHTLHYVHFLT